jgi:foldase protein PrsA
MLKKISAILLSLVMFFSLVGCSAGNSNGNVADVNGEIISKEYFEKKFMILEKSYNEYYNQDIWTEEKDGKTFRELVRGRLLDSIIVETLVRQSLDSSDFELDDNELEEALSTYNSEIESNEELKKFYTDNGIDEEFIEKQIINQFYMEGLKDTIREEVKGSGEELDKYYDENVIEVRARDILFKDEESARDILLKIKSGEDFEELAKENSEDPSTAYKGGDLGFFPKARLEKELEDVAFSLEPGQVSDLIKTDLGYHILKVEETRTISELEEIDGMEDKADKYKEEYIEEKVAKEYGAVVEALKSEAEVKSFLNNIK